MLAPLSRKLIAIGDHVSVMARDEARIRTVAPEIVPIVCDYNDLGAVDGGLANATARCGTPDLIVAWIHGRAPDLRRKLAASVAPGGRFVQVLGSAHGDPSRPERLEEMKAVATRLPVTYQAVVLGFTMDSGRSRWLTDDEISGGVYGAIESGALLSIVGTVEPWSARP